MNINRSEFLVHQFVATLACANQTEHIHKRIGYTPKENKYNWWIMFRNEIHILQWQERNQYGDADTFLCEIINNN